MRQRGRSGSQARRMLEYQVVFDQVARRKDEFTARIKRRTTITDDGCLIYNGASRRGLYPRMNFRYNGKHVQIDACRVFLILRLGRPIYIGMEAGHTCNNTRCVQHLEEITWQENQREKNARQYGYDEPPPPDESTYSNPSSSPDPLDP